MVDLQQMRPDKYQGGFGLLRRLSRQLDRHVAEIDLSPLDSAVKEIHVTEKIVNERIGRMMIDFLRRARLLDPAFVHQNHAVRHFQRFFLIVRDKTLVIFNSS